MLEKSGNFVSPEKWEPCGGEGGLSVRKSGNHVGGGSCVRGVHGRGRAWQRGVRGGAGMCGRGGMHSRVGMRGSRACVGGGACVAWGMTDRQV